MKIFKLSAILAATAALAFYLGDSGAPSTVVISGSSLAQKTGAQGPPQELFEMVCTVIDGKAACDLENDALGGSCGGFGDVCEYCEASNPANTNEVEMCFPTEDPVGCAPITSGTENDCGDLVSGFCYWDPRFDLICLGRPGDPCANVLQDGC